jgi:hypothetical protein
MPCRPHLRELLRPDDAGRFMTIEAGMAGEDARVAPDRGEGPAAQAIRLLNENNAS